MGFLMTTQKNNSALNKAATLGVCYYPEHWDRAKWQGDAEQMREVGITLVRLAEFSWALLEPEAGKYDWQWLDDSIETLANEGLSIILGTPTATPPKWLIDTYPEILPVGIDGQVKKFGSRRHYCFSSEVYRQHCQRIVTEMANRYGEHPAVVAWQTDNEYDCHDTAVSYSDAALKAFQLWLANKYADITALNKAWGNVFWSMTYPSFAAIELPNQTVTEANPAHWMDFRRFTSDQVVSFNREQTEIIRLATAARAEKADITHNFMGRIFGFDHFDVGNDIDIPSWDSYPLGFLEDRSDHDRAFRDKFYRAGDPDFQALHHDLYRAVGDGRWGVMEQQPGPVNWAPYNPAPRAGMVRLWSWEAVAHGAEFVSYFRWRQAPFAQEQMHAGLLLPNSEPSPYLPEIQQFAKELQQVSQTDIDFFATSRETGSVAIVFDYPSAWAWEIQPQGQAFDYFALVFDVYRACRSLGLSVDFISADATLAQYNRYKMVFAPGLFTVTEEQQAIFAETTACCVLGPRFGSKTKDFSIPESLPPNLSESLLDVKVQQVESLSPDTVLPLADCDAEYDYEYGLQYWREYVTVGSQATVTQVLADGSAAVIEQQNIRYLTGWPDETMLNKLIKTLAGEQGLKTLELPEGIRVRQLGSYQLWINYSDDNYEIDSAGAELIVGDSLLMASGVTLLKI
jgi:beta-galactosidase